MSRIHERQIWGIKMLPLSEMNSYHVDSFPLLRNEMVFEFPAIGICFLDLW